MATKEFLLPDLGEGLTEGEIVRWLVDVGDTIAVDEPVAEVETAKAVVEVPSPYAGTITQLHGEAGQEVEVGKPLVTIDLGGAAPAAGEPATGDERGTTPEEAEVSDAVPEPEDDDDDGASGSVLVGYGTGGGGTARRRRLGGRGPEESGGHRTSRPLAKPPVRKLAKDLGIDLHEVPPSGPDGIITREDVQAFAEQDAEGAQPEAAPAAAQPATAGPPVTVPQAPSSDLVERRPLKGMRKAIAAQMARSRREIPEAVAWVDVDATEFMALRGQLNAQQGVDGVKVTPLALLMRACVAGLREFPEVNARLDTETEEVVIQRFVNLGFATQTEAGLMVPVVHGADRMSTLGLAAELNRLAAAARERKVTPEELQGSTFTLSNFGSFGVDGGDPVINFPEAAILGVGRIADKPWVVHDADGEPQLAVRKVQQLSIAFDHRICDGGEAAGFLRYVCDLVESPTKLLAAL